jgi:adenylate kinase
VRILILGQHGSGKSTLANILSQRLSLPTISTGRMFREIAGLPTANGRSVSHYLKTGTYLPDDIVVPMVHERLDQDDVRLGFVLEGYPRTLKQAEALSVPIDAVLCLTIHDDLSKQRLTARGRSDDTHDSILKRLHEYHVESDAILDYYHNKGILYLLDASQPANRVAEEALGYLDKNKELL